MTGRVRIDCARAVAAEVRGLLGRCFPGEDTGLVDRLYADLQRLYTGGWPGYRACDMPYHDLCHVLDVSLAMARLIDGHERSHAGAARLGLRRALLGMAVSLCHDTGYLRRVRDTRHRCGAEYTRTHVSRSGRFLAQYLPALGLAAEVPDALRLVQFTGYETDVSTIRLRAPLLQRLGCLIGTADILAQMADRCYLDRCRERLYPEFLQGGVTVDRAPDGRVSVRYRDAAELLRKTPEFMRGAVEDRLGRAFGGVHAYATVHFGGRNLYLEAIERNRARLAGVLAAGDDGALAQRFHADCRC